MALVNLIREIAPDEIYDLAAQRHVNVATNTILAETGNTVHPPARVAVAVVLDGSGLDVKTND